MKDICEATQLSGEEELEVSQKSSPTRPFLDQRSKKKNHVLSMFFRKKLPTFFNSIYSSMLATVLPFWRTLALLFGTLILIAKTGTQNLK